MTLFFDTNIFVYTLDRTAPQKRERAVELLESAIADRTLITSYQVIQEFLHVATSKFRHSASPAEAQRFAEIALWPWCRIYPSPQLYATALELRANTKWTFYDSLIVAAALAANCDVLYSEDLQHGRRIHGLEIRNPFACPPFA